MRHLMSAGLAALLLASAAAPTAQAAQDPVPVAAAIPERPISRLSASAPSSMLGTRRSAPPNFENGVRTPAASTTSSERGEGSLLRLNVWNPSRSVA